MIKEEKRNKPEKRGKNDLEKCVVLLPNVLMRIRKGGRKQSGLRLIEKG